MAQPSPSSAASGSTLAAPLAALYAAELLNTGFDWTCVKPHQLDNVRRFAEGEVVYRALVADDPGLGKTLSAAVISSLCHSRFSTSYGPARTLIVCPKSLMQQWASELLRFLKLEKHQVITFETNDVFESQLTLGKYFIISYERLVKMHGLYFHKVNEKGIGNRYVYKDNFDAGKSLSFFNNGSTFSCVIFDEIHVCRNMSTHRHHACVDVAPGAWRLGLSGTPVVNKMLDLFAITKVLRLDYAYDANFFKRMDDPRYRTLFTQFMSSVYTRATKDILNLPELKTRVESFDFTEDEHDIVMYWASVMIKQVDEFLKFQEQKRDGVNKTTGDGMWARVLVAFHRLKQACLHPDLPKLTQVAKDKAAGTLEAASDEEEEDKVDAQKAETGALPVVETSAVETIADVPGVLAQTYRKSSKFAFIADTVPTLEGGVLIYSTWSTPLKALQQMLESLDQKTGLFIGSASGEERNWLKHQFNAGAIKVMLLTYGAGGVGLNLAPRAKTVIHLDAAWTPAAARQASDRAHRMGCDSVVTEIFLAPKESSDSWVYDNIHKAKKHDMEKVARIAKKLNDVRVNDSVGMTIDAVCRMTDYFDAAVRAWRARREANGAAPVKVKLEEQLAEPGAGPSLQKDASSKRTHQSSGSGSTCADAIDLTGDEEGVPPPAKFQKTTPAQFVEVEPEVIIIE